MAQNEIVSTPGKIISQEDIETWINDQKIDWPNDDEDLDERITNPLKSAQASSVEVPTAEYEDDNKPSKLACFVTTGSPILLYKCFLLPGVNLIKLFWHKFTYSFYRLDVLIAMQQIMLMFINGLAYKKSVSKFTPK